MNKFESIVFFVIYSACDKINASIVLLKSLYWRNMSFFSSILAEEELAKLILLPLLWEVGEIQNIITGKCSIYFNHWIKQKIFTTFWLQNRSYKEIEKLKQKSIYVGIDNNQKSDWKRISPNEAKQELQHAIQLLFYFWNKILLNPDFWKESKEAIKKTMYMTFWLVKKELSEIISIDESLIKKQIQLMNTWGRKTKIDKDGVKLIISDPFIVVSLFKFCFPESYKRHIKNILWLDYNGLCSYIMDKIPSTLK